MKGPAFFILLAYASVLAAGFVFAWKKGAFTWD
jgi:NADH:ubiquinone oxidoreductase subunit 3 (subunit A)